MKGILFASFFGSSRTIKSMQDAINRNDRLESKQARRCQPMPQIDGARRLAVAWVGQSATQPCAAAGDFPDQRTATSTNLQRKMRKHCATP